MPQLPGLVIAGCSQDGLGGVQRQVGHRQQVTLQEASTRATVSQHKARSLSCYLWRTCTWRLGPSIWLPDACWARMTRQGALSKPRNSTPRCTGVCSARSQSAVQVTALLAGVAATYLEALLAGEAVDLRWHGRLTLCIEVPGSSRPGCQHAAWSAAAARSCRHAGRRLARIRTAACPAADHLHSLLLWLLWRLLLLLWLLQLPEALLQGVCLHSMG